LSNSVETGAKSALKSLQKIPLFVWQQAILLGLVICLCMSLAQLFWLLMGAGAHEPKSTLPTAINASLAERSTSVSARVDIAALSATDIFGKLSAKPQEAIKPSVSAVEQNAPETKLKLVLKGIIGSSDQNTARAIIADGDKQALYALNDKLPGGNRVFLAKVMQDKVILNNGGRFESLPLYGDVPAGANKSVRTRASSKRSSSSQNRRVNSASVNSLADGNTSLADVVKVSMVRESGKVVGYRVRPGKKRELFDSLGLKSGDIVTAVNGTNLDSSAKAMEVYKSMRETTSATFDIKRGEETFSLNIDTN